MLKKRALKLVSGLMALFIAIFSVTPGVNASTSVNSSFLISPEIMNVVVSTTGSSYAIIMWRTNGNMTSEVYFDILPHISINDYPWSKGDLVNLVTQHVIVLTNLSPGTTYYFRVRSRAVINGVQYDVVSPEYSFPTIPYTAYASPVPVTVTSPIPVITTPTLPATIPETPAVFPQPIVSPTPSPVPSVLGRPLAQLDLVQIPVAIDANGNYLTTAGNLITISGEVNNLWVNIPVLLESGQKLSSFTDASGLTFAENTLIIPVVKTSLGVDPVFQIMDENGDLGTRIIIETDDCEGTGKGATARVLVIKSVAGYTYRDLSVENPDLGKVGATLSIELKDIPKNARVILIITPFEGQEICDAVQRAALEAGLGEIVIGYVLHVDKINLQNRNDINSALITMTAGRQWIESHGGPESIRIIRCVIEENVHQILHTVFKGYNEEGAGVFQAESPDGLSVFALVGRKLPSLPVTASPLPQEKKGLWPVWLYSSAIVIFIVSFLIFLIIWRRKRQRNLEQND